LCAHERTMSDLFKPCLVCGELSKESRCSEHRITRTSREGHAAYKNNARWKNLSKKLRKLQPWCSECGATDDLTCDHIIPVKERSDLTYATENIQILCRSCNGSKAGQPPSEAQRAEVEQRLKNRKKPRCI